MSIVTFGRRQRIQFHAKGGLSHWRGEVGPAVYAITYKQDPTNRPKAHTVVFFGEADNLALQAGEINSDMKQWCEQHGGNCGELFVFAHEMPGSSKYERSHIQRQLVAEYDPLANY